MLRDGTLYAELELDKASGEFELDTKGYLRLYPSKEKLAYLNQWIGKELDLAEENHRARFDECAKNVETYKPIVTQLMNDGGRAILPSPIARTPADNVIASTVNRVTSATPIIAFDAYFEEDYPVIVPVDANDIREAGTVAIADDVSGMVPTPTLISSEDLARNFEHGMEFKNRERLDFFGHFHRVVQDCVIGASPVYWKTFAKPKKRTIIAPKLALPFVDVDDEEEREVSGEIVQWQIVPYNDVLRPNLDQSMDDLEWVSERNHELKTPSDIERAFVDEELHLVKDEEECAAFCAARSMLAVDDPKVRTDATTKKYDPQPPADICDVHDVWFYAYLKIKTEKDQKPVVRRFSLMGPYHRGRRQFMAIFNNPYNHQRRILEPFTQFLDGSSTVGISRHAQQLQTHLTQNEVQSAFHANNPLYWYNPDSYETARFFSKRDEPLHAGTFVPGKEGVDWGLVRGGFEHYSLLGLMQWNAGTNQDAAHSSDYEQGNRVVSHTSPQVVGAMLDKGGQNQILFLSLLNRGVQRVMRLYLETARQFQPMGENIPVRDPKTKALIMVPFRYPIGEVLDNFRISLTAAEEAVSRERDPDQMDRALQQHQQFSAFFAQVMQAMRDHNSTPEDMALLRKMLAGALELYERIIATTRADVRKFDLMPEVDRVIEQKQKALAQMQAQPPQPPLTGGMNAPSQAPQPAGSVPQTGAPSNGSGSPGVGAEPSVAGSATSPPDQGNPNSF